MQNKVNELQAQRNQALIQFYAAQKAIEAAEKAIESTTAQLKLIKEAQEASDGDQ